MGHSTPMDLNERLALVDSLENIILRGLKAMNTEGAPGIVNVVLSLDVAAEMLRILTTMFATLLTVNEYTEPQIKHMFAMAREAERAVQ